MLAVGSLTACGDGSVPAEVEVGTAGTLGVGDPYFSSAGNGGYDVQAYDLRASVTIDGPDRIDAVVTITAIATRPLASFSLDLVGLELGDVTVDGGPAVVERDGAEVVVSTPRPIPSGETFTVVVPYSGEPAGDGDAVQTLEDGGGWLDLGAYSAVLAEPVGAARWIPCNDHPSDKALFSATITVPAPLEAVANGLLVERSDTGASSTFRWVAEEPMAPYLMTLAIGDYELIERPPIGDAVVMDAYPPDRVDLGRTAFGAFPDMVQFFSDRFGTYPFSAAGNIIVPGMPPTALETQTRSLFSETLLADGGTPELVAHELAHQWFGDAVTPATWRDIWLNEGPAVYSQWLWTEHIGGPSVIESAAAAYDPEDPDLDVPPADPGVAELFGTSVYVRSAIFLVELHQRMGDQRFTTLLRTWVDRHRFGSATTAEFEALANEVNGEPLDDLMQPWLYGDELPGLTFG